MSREKKQRKRRIQEIKKAAEEARGIRVELAQALNSFDHMTDPTRMDACIYEINALRARYNCAVKELRQLPPP